MIYILLPYFPSDSSMEVLHRSISSQNQRIQVLSLDTQKYSLYWSKAMQNLYWALIGGTNWQNDDIVCFMNTDLEFDKDFFTIVEHNIKQGEILIPKVYEDGKLIDGGITINWSKKSFKPGYRIDCFSPRGICMTVKDFRESGGFRWRLLPHYGSDYDWSIRQLKRGLTAKRLPGFNIYHRKHSRPTAGRFSKLNPANPWYWTIFILLHCPKKYWFINILKAWL